MKNTNFNELALKAYESAKARGFHEVTHTDSHYIMLVACELAEAVEADRCGRRADRKSYDFLSKEYGDTLISHLFEMHIKDSVEDELADAVIRLLDYIGMKGIAIPDWDISEPVINAILDMTFRDGWKHYQTFAERVFVACVGNIEMAKELPESTIYSIFAIAGLYDIDLMWFIREKMKYNEQRERLHGKGY